MFGPSNKKPHESGPGCSKLTASLVNVSLKFQMLMSEIYQLFVVKIGAFALQKQLSFISTKNINVFGY